MPVRAHRGNGEWTYWTKAYGDWNPTPVAHVARRQCLKCGELFTPLDATGRTSRFIRLCRRCHAVNSMDNAGAIPVHRISGSMLGIKYDGTGKFRAEHMMGVGPR